MNLVLLTAPVLAVKYTQELKINEATTADGSEPNIEDRHYMKTISTIIEHRWVSPTPKQYPKDIYKRFKKKELKTLQATVKFDITKDGEVEDLKLIKSSGIAQFDDSCLAAIKSTAPFPTPKDPKEIEYEFNYSYEHHNFWKRLTY